MKKLFTALLVLTMSSFVLSSTHADSIPAEQFSAPNEPGPGYYGYRSMPDFLLHFSNPYLLGMETDGHKPSVVNSCSSLSDAKCAKSDYWKFMAGLDFCNPTLVINCIEGVTASDSSGVPLNVNIAQAFPGVRSQDFVGDSAFDLPNGGQIHLVSIPGAPHPGGDLYAPIVLIHGVKDSNLNSPASFTMDQVSIGLYAVSINNAHYDTLLQSTNAAQYVDRSWGFGGGAADGCAVNDAFTCAAKQPLPLNIKFGIKIRVSFKIPGWMHGLFSDPNIKVVSAAPNQSTLEISANAVQSPVFALWKKKTELPQSLIDFYAARPQPLGGSGSGAGNQTLQSGDPAKWSLMFDPTSFGQFDMDQFLQWLPIFGDKATADSTYWNVFADGGYISGRNCALMPNQVSGVISTNAAEYIAGPPQWDANSQTLDYKVASAHYMASGEVFKGTYDLAIQSDYARCLYGFTKAPISATVSVVSNSGDATVATTSVREENNYLYLSAKGFTFSNPTIKVRLTQEAPPVAAPVTPETPNTPVIAPAPTKPVAAAKKITITCVKGKITKKVISLKPNCPSGYKKK